jgi:hypothetical protein
MAHFITGIFSIFLEFPSLDILSVVAAMLFFFQILNCAMTDESRQPLTKWRGKTPQTGHATISSLI